MRKYLLLLSTVILCTSLLFSCADNDTEPSGKKKKRKTSDDEPALGLRLESKSRLARIPIALTPFGGDDLPKSVDLSGDMPEVGNQGEQQSCVAWALAYALKSYQEKKENGMQLQFSPSYIYNQINGGENVPTYVIDGLEVLARQGVCLYEEMPYNSAKWTDKPTNNLKRSARRFRIDYWKQVNIGEIREVKAHLAAGYPIVIAAMVSGDFIKEGYEKKDDFIWNKKGKTVGGHAMVLVGYDDKKEAFKYMNSWGKEWGDDGFGWVSYDIFEDVIPYGFIAKDGYTDEGALQNPGMLNDEKQDEKANDYLDPTDEPSTRDTVEFHRSNVTYDVKIPKDDKNGPAMKIEGTLDIPPGVGKTFQIVVHVYDAATDKQVKSLIYPDYSDIDNFTAGYTPIYDIDEKGFRKGTWWLHIPYSAMDLSKGQTNLYAIPTLFIDNFGVAFGERIDFWVKK